MRNTELSAMITELERQLPELPLKYMVSWREITTLGVGSEIPVVAEPTDDIMLARLLAFCRERTLPVLLVGGGSNLVGCDAEFAGIVVRLRQNDFVRLRFGRNHVTVGGGVRLADLVNSCARHGFGALAPLVGIPGTVGGALRMNAGAHDVTLSEFVIELFGWHLDGTPWTAVREDIQWRYRASSLPEDVVITGAILRLDSGIDKEAARKVSYYLDLRRQHEPRGRSAGCAFRNIAPDEPAGRLIDRCGLKGAVSGGAGISDKHANYLMNGGEASENDVVELLSRVRREVAAQTGLYLVPEYCFADPAALRRVLAAAVPPRVAVLKGGDSSEREVSLRSGAAVAQALRNANYPVREIDLKSCEVLPEMADAEVIFPVLHGGFGEDGSLQAVLEAAHLNFVGSSSAACRLVMDKIATKQLLETMQLPTARWATVSREHPEFPDGLQLPVMIKAPWQGSTIGIAKVEKAADWAAALEKIFVYDEVLLVEEFIAGSEITVPVVNGRVMPVVEIQSPHGFYDYDAKYVYQNGKTNYFCPPRTISERTQREASAAALKFYVAAGCRDLLRVDFMVDAAGNSFMLEGNALPGFTATSLVPKAAQVAGMSFERLCASLVQAARQRA